MATGKHSLSSVVKGSEEIFDTCCSPCSESGKITEAVKYCVDCGSNFCAKCLKHHNKFPALRSHQILDKSGQGETEGKNESGTGLPTERCAIHHGKLVDMFCKDHDEVCCAACIAIKHRSCVNVDYLPDVAKGIHNNAEFNETKTSLENVLTKMKREIQNKTEKLKLLSEEKDQLFDEIEKLKTEILVKVEELVEKSKQHISLKYGDVSKHVQSDLDVLNTGIMTTTTNLQKLSGKNEAQLFVNIKTSKLSIRDCKTLLDDLSTGKVSEKFGLAVDRGLIDKLSSESLVTVVGNNVKEYKVTTYGKFTINPNHCEITGICTMDDGSFVIADFTNNKLKRLNDQLVVKDHVTVGGNPYSVCKVGPNEVATYISGGRKILLVSVGQTLTVSNTISVSDSTYPVGVCYDTKLNALLLCDTTKVTVYKKTGEIIKTYEKNKNGDKLFTATRQVALNTTGQLMVVTDYSEHKVKALTRDGEICWTFSDLALKRPWGVCILPGDIILVSGLNSNNVLQIDKNGRKIGELLGASETLNRPFDLAFDERNSRLLVGCSSNEIRTYTLSKV